MGSIDIIFIIEPLKYYIENNSLWYYIIDNDIIDMMIWYYWKINVLLKEILFYWYWNEIMIWYYYGNDSIINVIENEIDEESIIDILMYH